MLAADLGSNDAYADLVVITAIDLSARRITDVNCVSTNVNGVYVSLGSLYVGGENGASISGAGRTVLHKFVLNDGDISYRASGVVSLGSSSSSIARGTSRSWARAVANQATLRSRAPMTVGMTRKAVPSKSDAFRESGGRAGVW